MRRLDALKVHYRKPEARDGKDMWALAKDSGSLDLNSAYSYLMLCEMFKDTCCIAEIEGDAVAFVSGFHKPSERETLFIWQIAVSKQMRGNGIATTLLKRLLARNENRGIRFIEATVGPDNLASRQMFLRLADELKATSKMSEQFSSDLFPDQESHAAELLIRIGPIPMSNKA